LKTQTKNGWLHVPAEILEREDLTLLEKCILGKVASFKKDCKMSNATMARTFSTSRRNIIFAVNRLVEARELDREVLQNGRILKISSEDSSPPSSERSSPLSKSSEESSLEVVKTVHPSSEDSSPKNTMRRQEEDTRESAPKTASKNSPTVFKKAQTLMEEIHGDTYLNYAKEGSCLKRFIEQITKKDKADPWPLLEAMIYQFAELRERDRTARGYWRTMEFSPSKLVANAEAIYEQLKQRTSEEHVTEAQRQFIRGMVAKL
jgi:hypothetical protein